MNAQEVSDANVTGVALMLAGAHGGLQLKPHGLMQITLDAAAVTPTEPPPISSTEIYRPTAEELTAASN